MAEKTLKEKTAQGLMWGGISNGIQQLLNLIFGIFLARLLLPADYGMVGMLAIFTAVAGTLQESGFTMALANKKDVSHRDFNAVFWFSTLTGCCLYTILFFCAPLISDFYHQPELTPLARFLFLGFLVSSTGIAHHAVIYRNLFVKQKALAQMIGLFVSGLTGVIMAFNGMAYWGIATQSVLYIAITNGLYWFYSRWHPTLQFDFSPLRGMFAFSSKLLLTNVFTVTNNNIFSVLLGKFYSTAEVGFYSQANKWNSMGYSFINNTINGISQPILANVADEQDRQLRVFRKMLRFTAFLSFPCMLGLALVAKELIIITITGKWLSCVPIMQLLCLWGAFFPITSLYSNLLISKGKSDVYMWNTILMGALQIATMILCYPYGIMTMLAIYVLINICWIASWQHFVHAEIGLKWAHSLKDIGSFMLIAATTIGVTYWITLPITNVYMLIISKIIIAALIYCSVMVLSRAVVFRECVSFILSKKPKR